MGGIRIYAVVTAAVLLSGLAAMLPFAWSGADVLSSSYRESAARDLEANARLFALAVAPDAGGKPGREPHEFARAARSGGDTRYTLIAGDGAVVVDSDEDAERMENHLNRPEIVSALAGETGIAVRSSATLGTDWMYVAVPLAGGGVVRAAASMEGFGHRLGLWWKRALIGFAAALAILAAMALLVSRLISRPIETTAAGAERYAGGDLSYKLPVTGAAEMRTLSLSMNSMAEELEARFKLASRQREEMRVLFENMSEGVLAVDDGGRVMLMNGAAQSIFSLPEVPSDAGIEAAVRNAELLNAIRETAAGGNPLEREIRVRRGENAESLVLTNTARINENGRNVGVLAVLRDVTRLRRLEIMRRDFVANVSHELRTPITAIQSSLETLLDDDSRDSGGAGEFAEMALRNAKRMSAIIDDLLFLAGMESGSGSDAGKIETCPVQPVVDEAVSLCGDEARSRKISFAVDCDAGLTALMNPQLVVHALVNLLDNAMKYGPDGGAIGVTARKDVGKTLITVSDEGPGIARRHQSRVFERFYRIDGADRAKKGTGLGLAIVKHIALAQGGDIQLESEIGAGSKFTLCLPRE